MEQQLVHYFFEEVSKKLSFLVDQHGFSPPHLEVDERIHFAFVVFVGRNLAIEFILDERECDVTCKIARVVDGKKIDDYAVNPEGTRVRDYLSNLLRRRGIREPFTKVGTLPLRQQIPITLGDFASTLKKYGSDILADSPTVLA